MEMFHSTSFRQSQIPTEEIQIFGDYTGEVIYTTITWKYKKRTPYDLSPGISTFNANKITKIYKQEPFLHHMKHFSHCVIQPFSFLVDWFAIKIAAKYQ